MPTFDGNIKTRTRVALDKDAFSPGMGTLGGAGSPTEQALVHGNRVEKIESTLDFLVVSKTTAIFMGPVVTNLLSTHDHIVIGNLTTTVVSNHTQTIIGIYNRTLIADHITVNLGPRINTFVNVKVEVHCAAKNTSEPTLFQKAVTNNMKAGLFKLDAFAMKVEITGQSLAFIVSQFQAGVVTTKCFGVENKAEQMKNWVGGLRNRLGAVHSGVKGLQLKTGGFAGNAVGTFVKLLVLGVNQFI